MKNNHNLLLYLFGILFTLGGAFLIDLFHPEITLYGICVLIIGIGGFIGAITNTATGE